jgi:hypothetical protein
MKANDMPVTSRRSIRFDVPACPCRRCDSDTQAARVLRDGQDDVDWAPTLSTAFRSIAASCSPLRSAYARCGTRSSRSVRGCPTRAEQSALVIEQLASHAQ